MPSTYSKGRAVVLILALLAGCGKSEPELPPDPTVDEARRLLAEAGYPGGEGFPKLELIYNTADHHKKIASTIQERWRVALGIEVRLRNVEFPVLAGLVDQGEFDIARRGWFGEY